MDNSKFRVVPNVDVKWGMTDYSSLYAIVHGGFQPNTYLDLLTESRYVMPFGNVLPSFSHLDLEAGVKVGELSGFRFDVFGGYRKTDDAHFLVLNEQVSETLKPLYATLSHSFLGGWCTPTCGLPWMYHCA